MTGWYIAAGVLLVLILLGLVRVGGEAEYGETGLRVKLRAGWFRFQVFPAKKPKEEKPPKPKKKKAKQETTEEPQKRGGSLSLVRAYLPLIGEAAGELKRKICIDRLDIVFCSAAADAADAAMAFGYANMAFGMVWPILEQNFKVREHRFQTAVDFQAEEPELYLKAAFSARLGQLVSFACRFGWKAFRVYRRTVKTQKTQKGANRDERASVE